LEQLLNHTAGIKAYISGAEYLTLPKLEGNVPEQRLAFAAYTLAHDTLLNIGNFTYSNAGYVLAAAMLEKVSKKSWEKLVEETFKELKISSYFIGFPNKENVNNAWGHWLNGTDTLQALAPNNPYKLENFVAPAGNVSMDILDYATFIQGHLKGLCGSDNYLKKEMYEKMHFGNENYALGWGNGKNTNGLVSTHNGSTGTFYCHTILYKEKKIAIIVIANASSPSINEAILSMRRTLFNGYNNAN
jgi:D-alanyl-D-alanine carboxypeptidase